jgi:hypothetical protein
MKQEDGFRFLLDSGEHHTGLPWLPDPPPFTYQSPSPEQIGPHIQQVEVCDRNKAINLKRS